MRITELTDHHIDSGIGYYSFELTRALQRIDEATLYKPSRDNHPDYALEKQYPWLKGLWYKSLKQYRPYVLPFFLRAGITPGNTDLVHAHWYLSGLAATYLVNKPVVVTMHDVSLLHISDSNDRYLDYYKWAINRFREREIPLIVVSEAARQDTITYANYPEELVYAVHNGISNDRFYPIEKQTASDRFTIVYSGGLGKRKRLDLLLEALKIVQEKYPEVALKVAGSSPENTGYPQLVEALKIKNVSFTGFVPDDQMNEFYNSGNLMVYTSSYEGFGMAPLEGMACGLPVISTKGGALEEVSGGGAVMVDDDKEAIADKIITLIEADQQRNELTNRGMEWVKQYTWARTAELTHNIYQKVA